MKNLILISLLVIGIGNVFSQYDSINCVKRKIQFEITINPVDPETWQLVYVGDVFPRWRIAFFNSFQTTTWTEMVVGLDYSFPTIEFSSGKFPLTFYVGIQAGSSKGKFKEGFYLKEEWKIFSHGTKKGNQHSINLVVYESFTKNHRLKRDICFESWFGISYTF